MTKLDVDLSKTGNGNQNQLPKMMSVHDVAKTLNCSSRTVYRLADSGRLPRPVKIGSLVRWPEGQISNWINQGCPRVQKGGEK